MLQKFGLKVNFAPVMATSCAVLGVAAAVTGLKLASVATDGNRAALGQAFAEADVTDFAARRSIERVIKNEDCGTVRPDLQTVCEAVHATAVKLGYGAPTIK